MSAISSVLCLYCLFGQEINRPPAAATSDDVFVVHAKVLEALEGGPLVILVTLDYNGKKDIKVETNSFSKNSYVSPPANWNYRLVVRGISGQRHGHRKLSPGEQWSEVHYVHHGWRDIPRGKVVFRVSWPICEPGEHGKEIACPVTTLEIDILPATRERTHALCRRLEEKLGPGRVKEEGQTNIREVMNYLEYTSHRELAPVAWRLIECPPEVYPVFDFIEMVYATAEDKGAVNRRLVKLASDPNYPRLGNIFWYWCRGRVTLSAGEMAPLLQAENVWIRALTGASFPGPYTKEWAEQLFRDLRASQQPLPDKHFAQLLSDLAANGFAARERAMHELQHHGEPIRGQLEKALRDNPTPEARSRIQRILEEIAKGSPPIVRTVLWLLADVDDPQADAMLRLLAEGTTDSWATLEAKSILMKRQPRKP